MPQLFIAIAAFATIGTVATMVIGKKLIRLNFEKLRKEANFRFSLVRVRENAESIAFYAGEDIEGKEINRRFTAVIGNMKEVNVAQRNLDFFTTFYNYLTWILPIVVVAPDYFAGNVEMGVVQQSSAAFSHVLDDLSLIVNSFESLSEFSAGIDRLYQFMHAIKAQDPDRFDGSPLMSLPPSRDFGNVVIHTEGIIDGGNKIELRLISSASALKADHASGKISALAIKELSLLTPDHKRNLVIGLNLEVRDYPTKFQQHNVGMSLFTDLQGILLLCLYFYLSAELGGKPPYCWPLWCWEVKSPSCNCWFVDRWIWYCGAPG